LSHSDHLGRFQRVCRDKKRQQTASLQWRRVGAVWAAGIAFPQEKMEGRNPELLSVRGLASGQHLLWRPITNETRAAAGILEVQFAEQSAPLVLKGDNASARRGREVQAKLLKWMVLLLFSCLIAR
jgi:hypothetical protein